MVKKLTRGRYLWTRTISSTIAGETVDSIIFMLIAFLGVVPVDQLPGMIAAQAIFKTSYEIIATPLTYGVIGIFKRYEGVGRYD